MGTGGNEEWKEILRSNYKDLIVLINTTTELEGEFRRLKICTNLQLREIWDNSGLTRKDKLLDFLRRGDSLRFEKFKTALENSGQENIVRDYLSRVREHQDKPQSPEDKRCSRLISESHRRCLHIYWNELLYSINITEIMPHLISSSALTELQLMTIDGMKIDLEKSWYLLRRLETGSEKLFDDFCDSLNSSKQEHLVANYLRPIVIPPVLGLEDLLTKFDDISLPAESAELRNKRSEERGSKSAYGVSDGILKGRVLIISNEYFAKQGLSKREGTECDVKNLTAFFDGQLKFSTAVVENKTAEEMRNELKKESQNLRSFDIFILFILSHGKSGEIYGLDGATVRVQDILTQFDGENCQQLLGKPKLFFMQACRDYESNVNNPQLDEKVSPKATDIVTEDSGIPAVTAAEVAKNLQEQKNDFINCASLTTLDLKSHKLADMAVFYSTCDGDPSWRVLSEGSYFVNCLLTIFYKYAHEKHVFDMMTQASRLMHMIEHTMKENNKKRVTFKQLGTTNSNLLKSVYFVI